MAIKVENQATLPDGHHTGVITECEETTVTYDPQKGPEETIRVVIHPAYTDPEGRAVLDVAVNFSPVLNGLSALSNFLERIGQAPEDGSEWEPTSIIGTEVQFDCKHNDNGFVTIAKNSIRAA